jgi:hypothetical protein
VQSLIDKAARETRKDRTDYAHEYEEERLKDGEDYTVKATGSDNTTLSITYALMCRPLVYKMQNDSGLIQRWRNLGFKKVYLYDGYNYSWSFVL